MAKVTISGVAPWDGDYDLDLSRLTNRELHEIKKVSGVRAGELDDALSGGDNDVLVALALVAAARAGKMIPADRLWDADVESIVFDFREDEQQEDETVPPASGPEPADDASSSSELSGASSSPDGEIPPSGPDPTGGPGLEIVAA